jgi:hypothetical protein
MLKYPKIVDWKTGEKTVITEFVGSSLYVRNETVQEQSDIWATHLVLTSIDPEGRLNKTSVSGWYGMRDEDRREWTIDANDEAFERYRKRTYDFTHASILQRVTVMAVDPAVKGRVVKVVSGRTGKGTVGKVAVIIERPYGMGYRSAMMHKLGIATSPRKVTVAGKYGKTFENYADMIWVWAKNCEVEKPEPVDMNLVESEATKFAAAAERALRKEAQDANERMKAA